MTAGLRASALRVAIGGAEVLCGVSLEVGRSRVVGIVGPNGAGKTTLLDAMSGLVPVTSGTVTLAGTDVTRLPPHRRARLGLGRTFQGLDLFDDLDEDENLAVASQPQAVFAPLPVPRPAREADGPVRSLSHGRRKAVALERALAAGPSVLLLDEPAAGLDAEARRSLASRLRQLAEEGLAVVVADHDLDFVMAAADSVTVLDFGRVIADGTPAQVSDDPAVTAAYLGVTGGSQPAADRMPPGEVLVRAEGLVAGYGGAPAVDGLDLVVRAGEVVALLGPNGAGKTTTLRALSGLLRPAGGRLRVLGSDGRSTPDRLSRRGLAHAPQDRAVLGSLTVGENLRLATRRRPAATAAIERFPALVPLLDRRAGLLSGGEQQLLALARALACEPKVLLVDEPSLGLAPRTARQALDAVRDLASAGAGCVVAEQHPALAFEVADRAVVLVRGRCAYQGPAAELAARPDLLRRAYLGGD